MEREGENGGPSLKHLPEGKPSQAEEIPDEWLEMHADELWRVMFGRERTPFEDEALAPPLDAEGVGKRLLAALKKVAATKQSVVWDNCCRYPDTNK
jgi:hypothetical protein